MADHLVGNIIRAIDHCLFINDDRDLTALLLDIRGGFKSLLECIHAAESAVGRHIHYDFTKWMREVESLTLDFEDVILAYNLHLLQNNWRTDSTIGRLVQLLLRNNSDTVYLKILNFQTKYNRPRSNSYSRKARVNSSNSEVAKWTGLNAHFIMNLYEYLTLPISTLMVMCLKLTVNTLQDNTKPYTYKVKPTHSSPPPANWQMNASETLVYSKRMVGRDDEVKNLEEILLKEGDELVVFSVTGEEGIGKTTVASAVYNQVKLQFDCYAWVTVSHKSETNILSDMLTGLLDSLSMMAPSNLESLGTAILKEKLKWLLEGKQYLLVLDDVYDDKWKCIKSAFTDKCRGKILLTYPESRLPITTTSLSLKRLSLEYARQLLQKCALLDSKESDGFMYSIKKDAEKILLMCDGIPAAISLIGGMLSKKDKVGNQWSTVHERLSSAIQNLTSQKTRFLPSCYADLQPLLKSCFLYTSLFPHHYEISCKRLIRLYIAEGLVENLHNFKTIEDAARHQLYELIQRNLIQIGQVGEDGDIKTCYTIQLVQQFALEQSRKERFSTVINFRENYTLKRRGCYRLALHDENNVESLNQIDFNKLSSFLAFTRHKIVLSKYNFRLLLLLELQHLPLENLPSVVGDLALLKHLGLRYTKLEALPESLKRLRRLQTLDVRDTLIREVSILKWTCLQEMRNLLLAGSFKDITVDLSMDIGCLKNIQKLAGVKLTESSAEDLRHLSQLKKLSVGRLNSHLSKKLLESIQELRSLQSLTIKCAAGEKLNVYSNLPEGLVKLKVGGHAGNLLRDVNKLNCLRFLYMWNCEMIEDPLSSIHKLPNLVVISLCNAYVGREISFGKKSFPKLKKLSILHLKNLEACGDITKGSLQKLEKLTIGYCPKLSSIPDGLENLISLQMLQLTNMPDCFVEMLKEFHYNQREKKFSLRLPIAKVTRPTVLLPPVLPLYDFKTPSFHPKRKLM